MVDLKTGYTRLIIDTCLKHGLLRNQAAYVLATARWETAHTMKPVKEAYWLSETWRRNNLRYYPWYGRGFVQITWEANYQKAAKKTGVALDKDPDLALDPHTAADVLVIGMAEGWFTGKKLSDYITLRASNFVGARRIVNGTDKATQIANLAKQYDVLLKAEGYGERITPNAIKSKGASPESSDLGITPKTLLSLILSFFSNLFRRST